MVRRPYATEVRVKISDNFFDKESIVSLKTNASIFSGDSPGIGGTVAGDLDLVLLKPSVYIPPQAEIRVESRITDGDRWSEWIPKGVYYIDTRQNEVREDGNDHLKIHAFDRMIFAESDYPSSKLSWPATDISVVKEIAAAMGCKVDPDTLAGMGFGYRINLPAGYSMRETLGYIGGMYAASWIMSDGGDLRMVGMMDIPKETFYLLDENRNAITFGGDRILV